MVKTSDINRVDIANICYFLSLFFDVFASVRGGNSAEVRLTVTGDKVLSDIAQVGIGNECRESVDGSDRDGGVGDLTLDIGDGGLYLCYGSCTIVDGFVEH